MGFMILKEDKKILLFALELWGLVKRPYFGYVFIHGPLEECCSSWSIKNPAEFALSWGIVFLHKFSFGALSYTIFILGWWLNEATCHPNQIAFASFISVTRSRVWCERPANIVHLNFCMAFNTVSHTTVIGKLRKCGLEEWTVGLFENCLDRRSQSCI